MKMDQFEAKLLEAINVEITNGKGWRVTLEPHLIDDDFLLDDFVIAFEHMKNIRYIIGQIEQTEKFSRNCSIKLRRFGKLLLCRELWFVAKTPEAVDYSLWTLLPRRRMPGDAYINFVVDPSLMVVGLLHHLSRRGFLMRDEVVGPISRFLNGFSYPEFPDHGHDPKTDFRHYAFLLQLGRLDEWVIAHQQLVQRFLQGAEKHVREEAKAALDFPTSSFEPQDGFGGGAFSPLGEFLLDVLARLGRGGHL